MLRKLEFHMNELVIKKSTLPIHDVPDKFMNLQMNFLITTRKVTNHVRSEVRLGSPRKGIRPVERSQN